MRPGAVPLAHSLLLGVALVQHVVVAAEDDFGAQGGVGAIQPPVV